MSWSEESKHRTLHKKGFQLRQLQKALQRNIEIVWSFGVREGLPLTWASFTIPFFVQFPFCELSFCFLWLGSFPLQTAPPPELAICVKWWNPAVFSPVLLCKLQFLKLVRGWHKALGAESLEESYQSGFSRRRTTIYLLVRSLKLKTNGYLSTPQLRMWLPRQQTSSWSCKEITQGLWKSGDCKTSSELWGGGLGGGKSFKGTHTLTWSLPHTYGQYWIYIYSPPSPCAFNYIFLVVNQAQSQHFFLL